MAWCCSLRQLRSTGNAVIAGSARRSYRYFRADSRQHETLEQEEIYEPDRVGTWVKVGSAARAVAALVVAVASLRAEYRAARVSQAQAWGYFWVRRPAVHIAQRCDGSISSG
jgi:hypothetical protein